LKHVLCAALSHNQTEITGLVIVPDGMKIVKILRQRNPNMIYKVHETNLITWNETRQLYAVFSSRFIEPSQQ
jgi:hypothetical protein